MKRDMIGDYLDAFEDEDDEDTMQDVYLIFGCDDRDYGLEIKKVTEIVALQKITEVPDMPDFVRGVINLRGSVIPVLDVRMRFNMPVVKYHDRTCIIIAKLESTTIGLIVDAVREVAKILPDQMEPPPNISEGTGSRYVRSIGKIGDSVKVILNLENFLREDELQNIEHGLISKKSDSIAV